MPPPAEGQDEGTVSWRELLAGAERSLAQAGLESPAVDARWIVQRASGHEGAELTIGLDEPATQRGVSHLDAMLARRRAGEPLQHVVGSWGFRTLDLLVDARALIPRPETEVVAGLALDAIADVASPTAVDLGTGTGAIALSLAAEHPTVEVWATDRSVDALDVARANLAGLGRPAARVRIAEGVWFGALPAELLGRLDLVVSNPPYVAEGDELPDEVRLWEPAVALVPGPTGLEDVELIVAEATRWLQPGGVLVVEHGATQAAAVRALAEAAGLVEVRTESDLAGRDRALVAVRPR
jgi:release factor glutamine methyltransferase